MVKFTLIQVQTACTRIYLLWVILAPVSQENQTNNQRNNQNMNQFMIQRQYWMNLMRRKYFMEVQVRRRRLNQIFQVILINLHKVHQAIQHHHLFNHHLFNPHPWSHKRSSKDCSHHLNNPSTNNNPTNYLCCPTSIHKSHYHL